MRVVLCLVQRGTFRAFRLQRNVPQSLQFRRLQFRGGHFGGTNDAIFISRRGTWLSPQNVRRQWRQARADTGFEWVTPHTFRKTVATLIDKETDAARAAAQLGNTKEITKKHYVVKPALAPDSSDILEQLGADETAQDPKRPDHGRPRAAS